MFGLNDVLQRKGTVVNFFIGRDMQDCLLLAKRKFGGAKIHYTGIYNTHAIDPMYALKVCRVNDIYRKLLRIIHLVFPILILGLRCDPSGRMM